MLLPQLFEISCNLKLAIEPRPAIANMREQRPGGFFRAQLDEGSQPFVICRHPGIAFGQCFKDA